MQEEEEEEEILGSDDDEQEAPSDYCKVNNIFKWSFIFRIPYYWWIRDPEKTCTGSKGFKKKCRIRILSIGRKKSVAVPGPGSGAFLTFWVRDPDLVSGSGMNNPNHISESL